MIKIVISILFIVFLFFPFVLLATETPRFIHILVSLCDNQYQGIVPVPAKLGDGADPANNLYWGALYGVKTFLKKSEDWELVECNSVDSVVLERCVFKYKSKEQDVFLIADAYRGKEIKQTTEDFLQAAGGSLSVTVYLKDGWRLEAGSGADLIVYVGHNGLMDFAVKQPQIGSHEKHREIIILACASKQYFEKYIKAAGAFPLLWTTGLMAPEAYTLESALDGWVEREHNQEIRNRAASSYSKYQNCSMGAAKRLLVTGY